MADNQYPLCDIKNGSPFVLAVVDQHQISYLLCHLLMSADTKNQFLIIKKHLSPYLDPQGPDLSPLPWCHTVMLRRGGAAPLRCHAVVEPRRGGTAPWRSRAVVPPRGGVTPWRSCVVVLHRGGVTMEKPRPRRGGVTLASWWCHAVEEPCPRR
jgi:hypothetical protein